MKLVKIKSKFMFYMFSVFLFPCMQLKAQVVLDVDQTSTLKEVDRLFIGAVTNLSSRSGAKVAIHNNRGIPDLSSSFFRQPPANTSSSQLIISGHASSLRTGSSTDTPFPVLLPWTSFDPLPPLAPKVMSGFPSQTEELTATLSHLRQRLGSVNLFALMALDSFGRGCQQALLEYLPDAPHLRLVQSVWATWTHRDWVRVVKNSPKEASVWLVCLRPHQLGPLLQAIQADDLSNRPRVLVLPFETGLQILLNYPDTQVQPISQDTLNRGARPQVVMVCPARPCSPKVIQRVVTRLVGAALQDIREQGKFAENLGSEKASQDMALRQTLWSLSVPPELVQMQPSPMKTKE